jgi:hypothetical protein
MFDRRENPVHLLDSLACFLRLWHGEPRDWYGIDAEKLAQVKLPDPLRRLYAFAGHWPGDNFWGSAFANQDHLAPFELLSTEGGHLVFAWENQGVWTCGTTCEGRDPPVWVRFEEEWQPLCDSLAQFLVTLCLHETLFGCRHVASGELIKEYLSAKGNAPVPLWLRGPFVQAVGDAPLGHHSFHLADGRLLVMDDDWCGTNSDALAQALPELFEPRAELEPGLRSRAPIWENPIVPKSIRTATLESLAKQHEQQAEFHTRRAAGYRQLARLIQA